MDYKEKYNTALEMAREAFYSPETPHFAKAWLLTLFPTIAESKDEQIRKKLLKAFGSMVKEQWGGIAIEDILAWLEKQTEQRVEDFSQTCKTETLMTLDEAIEHCKKKSCDDTLCGKEHKQLAEWLTELKGYRVSVTQETQNPTDKVEPKFRPGDWIIRSAKGFKHNTYHVKEVKDYYVCEELKGKRVTFTFSDVHNNFKLWDISDAKDGDVLVSKGKGGQEVGIAKEFIGKYGGYNKCFETYCYSESDGTLRIGEYIGGTYINPATKEQRNLLFQKMKEAGWEWDDEKKELKKIESKKLDPDKVVEWLNDQACLGWIEDVEVDKFVAKFKKDFKL